MDKELERRYLTEAFGGVLAREFDGKDECPDFILQLPEKILGVEVTSVYSSNAAAKLVREPNYAENLTSGEGRIHRSDRDIVDVIQGATLTIHGKEHIANGIRHRVPAMPELIALLVAKVEEKDSRYDVYTQRCDVCDLVIADDEGIFFFWDWLSLAVWVNRFLPKGRMVGSPFREIYLTTGSVEFLKVSIPLKGIHLFSDCMAYVGLIDDAVDRFDLFCACLLLEGYTLARPMKGRGSSYIQFGVWLMEIKSTSVEVIHLCLDPEQWTSPTLEQSMRSVDQQVISEARNLVQARENRLPSEQILFTSKGTHKQPTSGDVVHLVRVRPDLSKPHPLASLS